MPKRKARSTSNNLRKNLRSTSINLRKNLRSTSSITKANPAKKARIERHASTEKKKNESPSTTPKVLPNCDDNVDSDLENSSPRLFIDTDECASENPSIKTVHKPVTRTTPTNVEKSTSEGTKKNSAPEECRTTANDNTIGERVREDNRFNSPDVNRASDRHHNSNIPTQSCIPRITVSLDRNRQEENDDPIMRQQDTNEGFNRRIRTSTPIRPSQYSARGVELIDDSLDLFAIESIAPDQYAILSRFDEFRRLVKAYKTEKRKNIAWAKDYARLEKEYNNLRESSFPRPPPAALEYLIELVTLIKHSSGSTDNRSDAELAHEININLRILTGLRDDSPQQTALNIFNALYPGYRNKVNIGTLDDLDENKPDLLQAILTFSQRAAPGVFYKMQELRHCFNNSIRGARHNLKKNQNLLAEVAEAFDEELAREISNDHNHTNGC